MTDAANIHWLRKPSPPAKPRWMPLQKLGELTLDKLGERWSVPRTNITNPAQSAEQENTNG